MGAFDGLRGDQISYGYWGNHTSTIDWCETNYSHSPYIAEFVNTLTNLPSIILGIYGAVVTYKQGLPWRFPLSYLGGTLIGLGSFGFHASLKWEWQLMDELPMIYVVSHACYLAFDTNPGFEPRFGIWGPLVLVGWCVFVTLSYAYMPNPVYHQVAFAAILLTTVGRFCILIRRLPDPASSTQSISQSQPQTSEISAASGDGAGAHADVKNEELVSGAGAQTQTQSQAAPNPKAITITTLLRGVIIFALGFVIWNIDNLFCDHLQAFRGHGAVPEFLGLMSHGHGWWHLMTGYGAFLLLTAGIYLQLSLKTSPHKYTFDPKDWFPITRRVATPATASVGDQAGKAGKEKKNEKQRLAQ